MAKLLIIEDEADIRELISFNLEMNGYEIEKARDGEEGLDKAKKGDFDLIILDLMLPGMDGIKVCSQLRKDADKKDVPIIMLTAKSEDEDIIKGLESGADDYITKPFSPRILVARVNAALRRSKNGSSEGESTRISIHDLVIDSARHEILLKGSPIVLSATEFGILRFLAKNPGWVFSRNQIIDSVKGEDYPVTARSVDVQILGIRKKLGECGHIIETVRGIGYRMKGE
ncbi:response regulator transcription factor [Oceanispirochaeta crateris]|jgi:two-component system phosphate regulon response regulator PhoB|uniref:Response regulator transcription factor n=1 Tax=Oceanispirochaeta crateris TaxID=2518645 RepID=A0A5C1QP19_9SPIO|nr:response regulator transcription factor [Oceanispirochaeta crateris]QEN09713.1 response regulator transcription factor [Oceanispirochaeta crateris]